MPIPGNLLTTAMAVMPHTDVDRAMQVALSMDIPFWPQLPRFSYYEDMYVQASEHFPGMVLDLEKRRLGFSLDVYTNGEVFASYATAVRRFLDRGGVLAWGIVPTNLEPFEREDMASLEGRLMGAWKRLWEKGIDRDFLLSRSLLSPATCCLVNPDGEKTVEKAFSVVKALSSRLRERYGL